MKMKKISITVRDVEGIDHQLSVETGANLRQVLLEKGLSPYVPLTEKWNCGGRGLCATCGVWIEEGSPDPDHWHDRAAHQFGYPRLSCQITVNEPMIIQLPKKWIWGKRKKRDRS
jgi:ferredoxin